MKMTAFRKHMKKEMILLLAAAALMLSACGGSSEGDTEETTAASAQQAAAGSMDPAYAAMAGEIAAVDPKRPDSLGEISLGEYKGIDIEAEEAAQVTNDEAIAFIETNILPYYLEETGEPAAEGDTVTIDFAGTMDGVAFDGGTAEGQTFVLGMGGYIDGFEDGIVGMKAGETKDVDVTFPEDYGNAELAGKPATFAITVSSVQNQRELDDELAQELNSECSTKEEYISFVRDVLQEEADNNAEYALYDNAVQAVIAGCSDLSPSEEAIDWRMDETIKSDDLMLQSTYGIGLADYLSMYGVTLDDYRDSIRENCTEQVRQYLVTEAICDAEGFEAGEAELEEWAAQNGVDMETVNATYDEEEAAIRCRAYLAAKFIADNGNVTYVSAEETEAE